MVLFGFPDLASPERSEIRTARQTKTTPAAADAVLSHAWLNQTARTLT
jgi:hypothetical protein